MKIQFFKFGVCFMKNHDGIAYQDIYEIHFYPLPWIIWDRANYNSLAFGWRQGNFIPEIYRSKP